MLYGIKSRIALEEYLSSFKVYIFKHYYFIDGHENVIKEKIYNTGTNNERLERAEKFYRLNILQYVYLKLASCVELHSNQMWMDFREFYNLIGVFEKLLKIKKAGH